MNLAPKVPSPAHALLALAALLGGCGGGSGGGAATGGGGTTEPATASAPTITLGLSNSFVDPMSGETKGDPTGFATVAFSLEQESGESANVRVEYSTNGGGVWSPATIVESLTGLGASATAQVTPGASSVSNHEVTWNLVADVGPGDFSDANAGAGFPGIMVRVRVLGGDPSPPADDDVEVDLMGIAVPGGDPLGTARSGHVTSVLPNGNLLVFGGEGASGVTASGEVGFRPDGVTDFDFESAGVLSTARRDATATVLADTRVLIVGGHDGSSDSSAVDVYDPVSGTTSSAASLNRARSGHTAGLLANGHVLVVGGESGGADGTYETYDPDADAWTEGSLSGSFAGHAMARIGGDGFMVIGSAPSVDLPASEIVVLQGDGTIAVTAGPTPQASRFDATATALPDGRVLVVGGHTAAGSASDPAAEVYDPATNAFVAIGATNPSVPGFTLAARWGHTATALGDGSVLITGGRTSSSGGLLSQTEFFLPLSDVFTPASPLPEARADHQVDVLSGGFAVVTGGVTGDAAEETPVGGAATLVPPAGINTPPSAGDGSITYDDSTDVATLGFDLIDFEGDESRVRVDWTVTPLDDASWRPATRKEDGGVPQGDDLVGLAASAEGIGYEFHWDVAADGVFSGSGTVSVSLRITPVGATDGTPLVVTESITEP